MPIRTNSGAARSDRRSRARNVLRRAACIEALERRQLLTWIGALSGNTNDAAHDYNNLDNWSNGTINDSFKNVTFTGATTIYLSADRTTQFGLNLNYLGNSNLTLMSDSSTTRTLTLAGGIIGADFGGSANHDTVTLGNASNPLNLDMNATASILNLGAGDHLNIANTVLDGSLVNSDTAVGWTAGDVGAPGTAGGSYFDGSTWTVTSSGVGIQSQSDELQFTSQQVRSDRSLTARVISQTSTSTSAASGIMFRVDDSANAPFAAVLVTPQNNIIFQWRTASGASAGTTSVSGPASGAVYVRIRRSGGSNFTGYFSADGVTWTQIGTTQSISMPTTVQAGLAVTSGNDSAVNSATFDSVGLSATFIYWHTHNAVLIRFDRDVSASLTAGTLVMQNTTNPASVLTAADAVLTYDSSTNTATWTWPAIVNEAGITGALSNGWWVATIDREDVTDIHGTPLSSDIVLDCPILLGDSDHVISNDGTTDSLNVDGSDFSNVVHNYNKSPRTYAQGDLDNSGTVDGADYNEVTRYYNATLSAPPTAPGELVISSNGTSALNVSWSPPSGGGTIDSYELQRSFDGETFQNYKTGLTDPSFPDTGLADGTRVWYRARAKYANGSFSAYSPKRALTTLLIAPTSFTATAIDDTHALLNWAHTGSNFDQYELAVAASGQDIGAATPISIDKGKTNYTVNGLTPGTAYTFRLWARKGTTNSGPLDQTATTTAIDANLAVPSNLHQDTNGVADVTTSVLLRWQNLSYAQDGFSIEMDPGTGVFTPVDHVTSYFATSALITGLTPATTYHFRMRACTTSPATFSNYTASIVATTATSGTPSVPADTMTAQGVDFSGVAGQPFSGTVATFTDSDSTAIASQFAASIDWGDGNVSVGTITSANGGFTVSGANTYTAPDSAQVVVQINRVGGETTSVHDTATIVDSPPTVVTSANATRSFDGTSVALSVLGADAAGEDQLTYTWSVVGGTGVTFDTNANNDAKTTTAILSATGTYNFSVAISNPFGQTVTSSVSIPVAQVVSNISVTPPAPSIAPGQTQQLTATAVDQFGVPMVAQPGFNWSVPNNVGWVDATGLYHAPSSVVTGEAGGVQASSGTGFYLSESDTVTIADELTLTATATSANRIDVGYSFPLNSWATIRIKGPDDLNFHMLGPVFPYLATPGNTNTSQYDTIYGARVNPNTQYTILLTCDQNGVETSKTVTVTTPGNPAPGSTLYSFPASAHIRQGVDVPLTAQIISTANPYDRVRFSWQAPAGLSTITIDIYSRIDNGIMGGYTLDAGLGSVDVTVPSWWNPQDLASSSIQFFAIGYGSDSSSTAEIAAVPQDAISVGIDAPAVYIVPSTVGGKQSVSLHWSDYSDSETGYIIDRSTDGGSSFTEIARLGADSTSYVDKDVHPGSGHLSYSVQAYIDGGMTSDRAFIPAIFPPAATNLAASVNNLTGTANLTWMNIAESTYPDSSYVSSGADQVEIQWSQDGTNFITIAQVPADTPSFTDPSPNLTGKNYYRVVYVRKAGYVEINYADASEFIQSDPSNVALAQPIAPPIAVDDDTAGPNNIGTDTPYITAHGQPLTVSAANGVLANDFDLQNLPLSVSAHTNPLHGTLVLNTDGSFTYTPNATFSGVDTFTYTLSNGTLQAPPANVAITVTKQPVTTAPDSYSVAAGATLNVPASGPNSLAANDSNPDNSTLTYSFSGPPPQHGTFTLNADGSFTYVPDAGYFGLDHFSYYVNDGTQNSNVSNVVIANAGAVYQPPTTVDTTFNPQTFPNTLKGLWASYLAAKDRLVEVGSAMAAFGDAAKAVGNIDPNTDAGNAVIDAAVAKLDAAYAAFDRYNKQLNKTVIAEGNYEKGTWITTQSSYDVISAIDSLPRDVLGMTPNQSQLQKFQVALANAVAGADWMLANNTFVVTAAKETHDALDKSIAAAGLASIAITGVEILATKGCEAFAQAAMKQIASVAVGQVVNIAIGQSSHYLHEKYGISEDSMRIAGDSVQLFCLLKAARQEQIKNNSNCFVAGTEVITARNSGSNGTFSEEPIEDIKIGDEVLSRNQYDPSAPAEERQVTAVEQHTVYSLADVTIRDANGQTEVIKATPEHPFYVDGLGWTGSSHLIAGEQLLEPGGKDATVVSIGSEFHPEGVTVYNFTVDTDHTYFVDQGGDGVWVHNACDVDDPDFMSPSAKAVHDAYAERVRPGAVQQRFKTSWSASKGLGDRVFDDYDPITKTGYEANTTPWSRMTMEQLQRKLDQVGSDFDLLHSNSEVKNVEWFGTEPLPTTGLGNQLRQALAGAGISYKVIP